MNCLCCGKALPDGRSETGWHKACIKHFFDTTELPEIDISEKAIELLATESTTKGYTVPGVQKKLSLHLLSEGKPRLTLMNHPTGYILKPQVKEFTALPEAEHLVMSMADACGIQTVLHALIKADSEYAYITRRIDRFSTVNGDVQKLAMEDFCQLDQRLTQDKYRGSYERCAKIITRYSARSGLDLSELFLRIVFSYIIGNSDMHLKNFSLIETGVGSGEYILSPAYDLLPVNVIMPEDSEQFALTINGKKRNITKNDLLIFAENCAINKKTAEKMIGKLGACRTLLTRMVAESLLPDGLKADLTKLISSRIDHIIAQ